jgi:hypothetical protein
VNRHEVLVGSETVDGHPTKQFKVTEFNPATKKDYVQFEWRATDLGDLVIQRKFEEGQSKLKNIVVGKPDEKLLTFPSPPCKFEEALDTTRDAPQAAGGSRTIRFSDASCRQLVPLPLTMSIPSDYAIRKGGHLGCFWGAETDLARLLATNDQADFDSIKRGVFWCRVSEGTEYDPIHHHFVSGDLGSDDQWAKAMPQATGAKNVVVTPKTVGGIAMLRVTASVQGKRLYMLYIGVGDSPAILINYRPAGKGDAADDAIWQHFLDSVQAEK